MRLQKVRDFRFWPQAAVEECLLFRRWSGLGERGENDAHDPQRTSNGRPPVPCLITCIGHDEQDQLS
jgi:hypothetical protein